MPFGVLGASKEQFEQFWFFGLDKFLPEWVQKGPGGFSEGFWPFWGVVMTLSPPFEYGLPVPKKKGSDSSGSSFRERANSALVIAL